MAWGFALRTETDVPRYHFRLLNGEDVRDPEGELLVDDDAARRATIAIMSETLSGRADHILEGGRYVIETTDDGGRLIYRLAVEGRVTRP